MTTHQNQIAEKLLGIKNLTVEPIYYRNQAVNKFAVCDESTIYSVVGRLYTPIAYQVLLGRVQEWLTESKFVSVAANKNLSKGIMTLELPGSDSVGGQEVKTYINLYNSLNGEWPIGIVVSPVRVACLNQFRLMHKQSMIHLRFKHTAAGRIQMDQDIPILKMVEDLMEEQVVRGELLAKRDLSDAKATSILANIEEEHFIRKDLLERARSLYFSPIRKEDEGRNMWTLFNAVTDPINREIERTGAAHNYDALNRVGQYFANAV